MMVPQSTDRPTVPIWPDAGKALGIGRSQAYAAAESGEIPTIRIGRRILVPTAALRRMLQLDEVDVQPVSVGGDRNAAA